MRVSAGLPTGMEGLTYPIPFSDPENVIKIAQAAEKFGYDSVWGNDHMSTQNYVRTEFPVPPRFWEKSRKNRIRFCKAWSIRQVVSTAARCASPSTTTNRRRKRGSRSQTR